MALHVGFRHGAAAAVRRTILVAVHGGVATYAGFAVASSTVGIVSAGLVLLAMVTGLVTVGLVISTVVDGLTAETAPGRPQPMAGGCSCCGEPMATLGSLRVCPACDHLPGARRVSGRSHRQ